MIRSRRVRAWLIGALVLSAAGIVTVVPLVASAASTRYEAESGTISSGTVDSDHTGFTGTGFVNLTNAAGTYLELSVTASAAGDATLTWRYSNGTTADRPMTISVNGAVVASALSFPSTGTWNTWATVSVHATLLAGPNTIRATSNTADGGPNLDSLTVDDGVVTPPSSPPPSPTSTLYEAETGTISTGTVDSNHTGFTGTGFVNLTNAVGSYLELGVTASAAGAATLAWRYSNGTTTDRPMTISVNGVTVASAQSFPSTGTWDTWATASVPATLVPGANTIRATSNTADGGPNLDSLTVIEGATTSPSPTPTPTGTGTDWSVKMVDSTMTRFTPSTLGGWGYTTGLYLVGQYLVYQRTHNPAYLTYIRQWADRFVGSDGSIGQSFSNLDSMQAGNVLMILYKETGQSKYKKAADKIWTRLEGTDGTNGTYPRTSDGGFWHSTSSDRAHQLWLDGTYMALPFLIRYGQAVGGTTQSIAYAEAVKQLLVYGGHLQAPNGLLWHAYDEAAAQSWVVPGTHHSPEFWCRAIGWYGMAAVTVLDAVPASQPNRAQLLSILQKLVAGMKNYQDPATGRWFEVVDKGSRSDNWTETSCSAMYTYTISRSVEQGYVDASYKSVATKGYAGVLARISLGSDGLTNLRTICEGTNVGDYAYYIGRAQNTNDKHGLGSFLIMNEQLRRTG
jgi:unsaturated rhamnogalacturonyl hydrolase